MGCAYLYGGGVDRGAPTDGGGLLEPGLGPVLRPRRARLGWLSAWSDGQVAVRLAAVRLGVCATRPPRGPALPVIGEGEWLAFGLVCADPSQARLVRGTCRLPAGPTRLRLHQAKARKDAGRVSDLCTETSSTIRPVSGSISSRRRFPETAASSQSLSRGRRSAEPSANRQRASRNMQVGTIPPPNDRGAKPRAPRCLQRLAKRGRWNRPGGQRGPKLARAALALRPRAH